VPPSLPTFPAARLKESNSPIEPAQAELAIVISLGPRLILYGAEVVDEALPPRLGNIVGSEVRLDCVNEI
jgi:hypothetical protein